MRKICICCDRSDSEGHWEQLEESNILNYS